jgi:hypothetical protein
VKIHRDCLLNFKLLEEVCSRQSENERLDAMSSKLKTGGVVAACAACCAVSIVPALLAGTGLAAIGGAFAWEVGLVALAGVALGGAYYVVRRKPATKSQATFQNLMASATDESCGCGPACGSASPEEQPIACALDAGDFKERTARIRALARHSLRHASRGPLTLTLIYAPEALEVVGELVAQEQTCCAFLTFDLRNDASAVILTITAPKAAAEAADALFDHFAPDLATSNIKELA